MQIPETPRTITELDLMKRLEAYGSGAASFSKDGNGLGDHLQRSCRLLYSALCRLSETVAPLLDRITAKEMDVFTAHDEQHALKVAHHTMKKHIVIGALGRSPVAPLFMRF